MGLISSKYSQIYVFSVIKESPWLQKGRSREVKGNEKEKRSGSRNEVQEKCGSKKGERIKVILLDTLIITPPIMS